MVKRQPKTDAVQPRLSAKAYAQLPPLCNSGDPVEYDLASVVATRTSRSAFFRRPAG